jgi:hypothetical protein
MKNDRSVNVVKLVVLLSVVITSLLIVPVCAAMQAGIPRISIQELKKIAKDSRKEHQQVLENDVLCFIKKPYLYIWNPWFTIIL